MGAYVLDVKSLAPLLRSGKCLIAKISSDKGEFSVTLAVDTSDPRDGFVELIHATRDLQERERTVIDHIRLVWTTPTYGGRRWWFLCPRTACRTTKLLLPRGGWHFWSRQAYGLRYACQREGRFDRLQRRAATLNRQAGGEGWSTWAIRPPKPKSMHWRTYERKIASWERAVNRAEDEWTHRAALLLNRIDRMTALSLSWLDAESGSIPLLL